MMILILMMTKIIIRFRIGGLMQRSSGLLENSKDAISSFFAGEGSSRKLSDPQNSTTRPCHLWGRCTAPKRCLPLSCLYNLSFAPSPHPPLHAQQLLEETWVEVVASRQRHGRRLQLLVHA
mmetsp:Transcript_116944/g.225581  ORF Transcript_116944/g.225581 Transcript_116944/m.225581 type:complete len:121 (-) Transcript_116944:51-413(-)